MKDFIAQCEIYPWNELTFYTSVLLVVFFIPIILVIVEYFQKFDKDSTNDINYIIRDWAYSKYYCITVFWGILVGHFFLGAKKEFVVFKEEVWSVVIIAVILLTMWFHGYKMGKRIFTKNQQLLFLILGACIGHFAWSMTGVSH